MNPVKLRINKQQWIFLASDLVWCVENGPVENWELETCLLAELYKSRVTFFTFFKPGKDGSATISLTASQAYAINNFLGRFSKTYNTYLRAIVEPYLASVRSKLPR